MNTSFMNTEVVKDLWWHVRQLGDARKTTNSVKVQVHNLEAQIQADIDKRWGFAQRALKTQLETAQAEVDRLYEQTALLGCQEFERTGSKSPHPAVGIREENILEFDDDAALELAQSKGRWLKLDVRSFKKDAKLELSKTSPDPDVAQVVSTRTEPKARIKTDLSQWSK